MVDTPEYERWRGAGGEFLAAARTLRGSGGHHSHTCFLAEQAAQLAVKGWLHGVGMGAQAWGHDLVALGAHLAEHSGVALEQRVADAVGRLSRHYIPSRYPDAHASGTPGEHFTATDAEQAITDAELVLAEVARRWTELSA